MTEEGVHTVQPRKAASASTVRLVSQPLILFIFDLLPDWKTGKESFLWLARDVGFEVVVASWRDIKVSASGTQIQRGYKVISHEAVVLLSAHTIIHPQIIIHRKLIWGLSEVLLKQLRERYPEALFSYHDHWKFVGQKLNTELCFQAAEELGVNVARPLTYQVDRAKVEAISRLGKTAPLIFKPVHGSSCAGILLSTPQDFEEVIERVLLSPKTQFIAQQLIENVTLYEGRKFDLRIYAMLMSERPLRYRLYREGVVRIAAKELAHEQSLDPLRILTGCTFRKRCGAPVDNLTVTELLEYLQRRGYDVRGFWAKMDLLVRDVFSSFAHAASARAADLKRCIYFAGMDILVVGAGPDVDLIFIETNYVPQMTRWGNAIDRGLQQIYGEWLTDLKAELLNPDAAS